MEDGFIGYGWIRGGLIEAKAGEEVEGLMRTGRGDERYRRESRALATDSKEMR